VGIRDSRVRTSADATCFCASVEHVLATRKNGYWQANYYDGYEFANSTNLSESVSRTT